MNMIAMTPSESLPPSSCNKAEWVSNARRSFDPGPRQPCEVCGQWNGLAEAHHVFPLAEQFDDGAVTPDQTFTWLCPNHHAAVHLLMAQIRGQRIDPSISVSMLTSELYGRGELDGLLALAAKRFPQVMGSAS